MPADDAVAETLRRHYWAGGSPPSWKIALQALADPAPAKRVEAGRWLTALMKRALADELSGAAGPDDGPFWGSSRVNPARELRRQIASALARAKSLPTETMPLIVYLVREEPLRVSQSDGAKALGLIAGAEAGNLRLALVSEPHANGQVVAAALEQLARGGASVPAAVTDALGRHPRAIVRDAARAIRGSPDFDPVAALVSPPVARIVDGIGRQLVDAPAPDAPFVRATTIDYDRQGKEEPDRDVVDGWVHKHNGDHYILLSPHGWTREITVGATKAPNTPGAYSTTAVEPRHIEDEVARIVAQIKKGDRKPLSEGSGVISGEFDDGPSTAEILIGWWAQRAGRPDLAAKLLLPALDAVVADEDLVDAVRQRLAHVYAYEMMVAFVGERDFAETLRVASFIATHFPGTAFHDYAVRLAAELPRRADDFRAFKLPTPEDWAQLRRTMSRAEQIAYLVARLRLLNCFQWMQPGGLDYFERQSAEPGGMTTDASSGGFRSGTLVINPAGELMGNPDDRTDAGKRARGMALTVDDIPQLALGLRDDWFMLAVSHWRSFHPARTMHVTSELLGWMINEVAKRNLIDPGAWAALDAAAREKEIARVTAWARAHSGWSEADLLVAALEDSLKAGPRWGVPRSSPVCWLTVMSHASRLVELKDARAVPLLLRGLESKPDSEVPEEIWALGRQIRPEAFRDLAAAHLSDARPGVRTEAGIIRLVTGDKEGGRRVLARVLAAADDYNLAGDHLIAAAEALLADGTPESRAIAQSLFAPARDERSIGDSVEADLARLFARHGLADPLRHYRRLLDRAGNRRRVDRDSVDKIYSQITLWLAPADPEMIRIKTSGATPAHSLPALSKWLDAKIDDPASLVQPPG